MTRPNAQVQFEETGDRLTAVEIGRGGRRPLIATLHHALFALGVVISSYHVQTREGQLVERMVFEREDGGALDDHLSMKTKEAILPIALGDE